jgi:hypothetical protein
MWSIESRDDLIICLAGMYEQKDSVEKLETLLKELANLREDCSMEAAKVETLLPQAQAVAPTSYMLPQTTQQPLSFILPNKVHTLSSDLVWSCLPILSVYLRFVDSA